MELGLDDGARGRQRPCGVAHALVLEQPQPPVAAVGADQPPFVGPARGHEDRVDAGLEQVTERGRGDGDVAVDEDAVDVHGGDGGDLVAVLLDDQAPRAVAQFGALGGDVARLAGGGREWRAELKGPDVGRPALRPGNAALVGGERRCRVPGVDRRRARQERHRSGESAVIRQGTQERVAGELGLAGPILHQVADVPCDLV